MKLTVLPWSLSLTGPMAIYDLDLGFNPTAGFPSARPIVKPTARSRTDYAAFIGLGQRSRGGLYAPADVEEANDRFKANCGPAAFAASTQRTICSVMNLFPKYPGRPWTTIGDMRAAVATDGIQSAETDVLPKHGLALIQMNKGEQWLHPMAALKLSHWVAVCDGHFYDINWNGWLPQGVWEQVVFQALRKRHVGVVGWTIRNAIELNLPSIPRPGRRGRCSRSRVAGRPPA